MSGSGLEKSSSPRSMCAWRAYQRLIRSQQANSKAEQTEVQSVKTAPSVRAVPGYAAVITAPRQIDVCRVEFRAPLPGEVRVKIEGCGVCASNLGLVRRKARVQWSAEPRAR